MMLDHHCEDELWHASLAARRTINPIRGIVDKLQVVNKEKSFITLALGNSFYFLTCQTR
jgi:hypothetical protein